MQNTDLHAHNLTQAVDSCHFSPGFLAVHAPNTRDVMKVTVLLQCYYSLRSWGFPVGLKATPLYQPCEMLYLLVTVGVMDLYLFQMTSQLTTSSHSTCQRRRIVTTHR